MQHDNAISSDLQALADEGRKLFPCVSRGKTPLLDEWPQRATSDLAQLGAWNLQYPGCDWGMATGPESKIFALDIDGTAGERWLERQIGTHGTDWMDTRQVATPHGMHFYFNWPNTTIRNSESKIASGVDVRGWHGFVVIPPSVNYNWRGSVAQRILPAPSWLLAILGKTRSPESHNRSNGSGRPIPEGQRNSTLASYAGGMRRRGMAETSIEAALLTENAVACSPPLPEREVETIAHSVARYSSEPQLILPRPITRGPENSEQLFETAAAFAARAPTQTEWLVRPYIPAGGLVELCGKIKAAGKSCLALHMTRAVLNGENFLGGACRKSPVVFLTEQGETSLRAALQKADLLSRADLHLLRWHKASGLAWLEIATLAVEKAMQTSSKLIVVDTLSQFAQLQGDAENNSGQALEVLRPLQSAQELGVGVLILRHEKKGNDVEVSDAARGSSAYGGAADVVMRLKRLGSCHPPSFRRLETLSRFDETPAEVIVELTENGYCLHQVAAVALEAAERKLLAALPTTEQSAKTCLELASATGGTRRTLERALLELVTAGNVKRVGVGIRNSAYRYYRPTEELEDAV